MQGRSPVSLLPVLNLRNVLDECFVMYFTTIGSLHFEIQSIKE